MKILIVDDNATNRMVIDAFLDDYMELNSNVKFEVDMAKDGVEAVRMTEELTYNIVFMDINMPNMDGIEASRRIRSRDSKVMIIAISAAEDAERKKEILDNGAEDYIVKPVNADIFNSRLKNYISLAEARNKENVSTKVINLYTNKVFNRHTRFLLDSEDSVAEFWEFFLLNARIKSDHLSDIIRVIVAIVDTQMSIENTNKVYIEESADKQYFTLVNIDVLPSKVVKLLLKKNSISEGYKLSNKKISFELLKVKKYENETQIEEIKEKEIILKTPQREEELNFKSNALEVFDYLDKDDLFDLEEYADNLNSLMLLVGGGALEENDILEMCGFLNQISALLSPYNEVYVISNALAELATSLATHIDVFAANSSTLGPMCNAFSNDLMNWIQQSFYTGAPSIEFMNDTIAVNAKTIASMLQMDDTPADDDFDDIFDF